MITGSISASDYLNAQRLHRAKSVRVYYAVSVAAIAVGVMSFYFFQQKLGFIIGSAGVGGVIGELVMSVFYIPWKTRRLYSQKKDLSSPFVYTWNSEYLEAKGISGQSKRKWSDYLMIKESESIFLLYQCDLIFEMFPKTWFKDQEQISEFRKFAFRSVET